MRKRGRFGSLLCATIAVVIAALIGAAGFGSTVLAQQAQGALPNFAFGRVIPPANDTILKRDRQHPPATIGFGFKIAPPANWIVTWTQDVQALGLRLAQEETRPQPGSWLLRYRLDPCKVVGLDMPGTPIPVTYEFVFAASGPNTSFNPPPRNGSFILTLDRDTVKPSITSLRAPTTVRRDQIIQVAVSATDVSDEMGGTLVWDSGLREFRLEGLSNPSQPGTQSSEQIYVADDSYPTSCDDKVKKADHTFSYTVPHSAQPGDEIRLRAWVEDWATNKTDKEVVLKVVGDWYGTIDWWIPSPYSRNWGRLDVTFDDDGRGNLKGRMTGDQHVESPPRGEFCGMTTQTPVKLSAHVVGQYTPGRNTMSLRFSDPQIEQGRFSMCAIGSSGGPLFMSGQPFGGGGPLGQPVLVQLLNSLTVRADGSVEASGEGPVAPAHSPQSTLHLKLTLRKVQN